MDSVFVLAQRSAGLLLRLRREATHLPEQPPRGLAAGRLDQLFDDGKTNPGPALDRVARLVNAIEARPGPTLAQP